MKFTTKINDAEKKVLMEEALSKQEKTLLGVLYQNSIDPESFDETTYTPDADDQEWQTDLAKKCADLIALRAKIAELG